MAALFVVDDDIASARSTRAILERLGNDVIIETNPRRALEILESDREIDLTFLDVLMPDLTGEEIVRRLRTTAPARLRRICFLTGMAYLVETWLRQTGIPFIEKPASMDTLARAVDQFSSLSCSRGPQDTTDMTKKHSHPDLGELIGDDELEEDDEDDDTGVFEATISKNQAADTVIVAAVKYVHKKNRRLARRVRALETWRDRIVWIAIGVGIGTGSLTITAWKLIEKALAH